MAASVGSPSGSLEASLPAPPGEEGGVERVKTQGSEDARSDSSSHHRRMSSLFKGRRKRSQSSSRGDVVAAASRLHHDVPPVPTVKLAGRLPTAPSQSTDSLGLAQSVASSLLTDASDSDRPATKHPTVSPHPSQTGLLASSSPSSPLAVSDTAASTQSLPIQNARTIDLAASKRLASPVAKLKDAFVPPRRSTAPRPAGDADETTKPPSGGGVLGSVFGGKKRQAKGREKPSQLPPATTEVQVTRPASAARTRASGGRAIASRPVTPPNLVDAPATLVTPPTPTDGASASRLPLTSAEKEPVLVASPDSSRSMTIHKHTRSHSDSLSKLSHSATAPLATFPEEIKTPGGTAHTPPSSTGPGGFFASIFSVAQSAATNITDTLASNSTGKSKNNPSSQKEDDKASREAGEEEAVVVLGKTEPVGIQQQQQQQQQQRPAVETLGSGNLSLAQLGISDNRDFAPPASATAASKTEDDRRKVESMAIAQAVSAAYAADKPASLASERPQSLHAGPAATTTSSPRQTEAVQSPVPAAMQRQGSIRSRISGGRRRRHRGSSAATTGNGSLTGLVLGAALHGNRLNGTGFAVAPPKRNRDFHNLFKSVPEDDYLIEDYSAALQKEILLHGRLYVSEAHLCFSSNILGWVTSLVISFDEVVSVEKKSTAVLFPNAIVISTLHARNVFASFLTRDATYDLIIGIWKISHPNLKSSLNGIALDGSATGDKTEKAESVGSEEGTLPDSDDEAYDDDEAGDEPGESSAKAADHTHPGSDMSAATADLAKISGAVAQAAGGGGEIVEAAKTAVSSAAARQDFPGPVIHAPTECGDNDRHCDKLLIDTTIPAPMGRVYSLMFGPASGAFMRKWLIEDQKSTDLQMEDDKKGLGEDRKTFSFSYIKPLSAPVGPRQTKCNIEMTLDQFDLDKAVSVLCSTATPDVPSGNIFLTKTRYCLMWGPSNDTRLIMTFVVEWSGKSWLRGPIEKGANDGQMSYATSLTTALRAAVSTKLAPLKTSAKGEKPRKRSKATSADEVPASVTAPAPVRPAQQSHWGVWEPLRGVFGPLADIIELCFAPHLLIPLLAILLIYSWFFRGASTPSSSLSSPAHAPHWSVAQRQVAHEAIWQYEESELWKWLEERVALDRVHPSAMGGRLAKEDEQHGSVPVSIHAATMREREMDEAIRVTEEKLKALKEAIHRKRALSQREGGLKEV